MRVLRFLVFGISQYYTINTFASMTSSNTLVQKPLFSENDSMPNQRNSFQMPEQVHKADMRFREGLALKESGKRDEALEYFAEAVYIAPSNKEYHLALGQLEFEMGHLEEAAFCFEKLTLLDPVNSSFWLTLGFIRFQLERYSEAILPLSQAVCIDASSPEATFYLAESIRHIERFEESIPLYQKMLAVGIDRPQAVYGYSLSLLALGRLEEGWEAFEFRRVSKIGSWQQHLLPNWSGVANKAQTVLAYSEEGIGADIMFSTCLPDLIESVGHCVIECDTALHSIFARSFPTASLVPLSAPGTIVGENQEDMKIDSQIALGSLPRYFRRNMSDFANRKPHLFADPEISGKWKNRLTERGVAKKVGFLWHGSWSGESEKQRTLPLDAFRPLISKGKRMNGQNAGFCDWISLQNGSQKSELNRIRTDWRIDMGAYPEVLPYNDFDELAGLLSSLDLVISPPGYVANFAAALGIPTWLVLPFPRDWRWTLCEETAVWFPNMRIFRQKPVQTWPTLVAEIAAALDSFVH